MERQEQLEKLFHGALACPASQRDAFLLQVCPYDEQLRSHVKSLVSAYEESGSFLDSPPFPALARALGDEEAEWLIGSRLGEYEILELISRGGMGWVYLASDWRLERRVALKLLPPKYTENQDRLRRFTLEARAASSLNHPNIITIHEIGSIDGEHFIVTEFVEGETLRKKISRGPLPASEVADVARQVASALSAAHGAGIVHRDIKPENIMVRPDGYVKVLDFGLAKLTEAPPHTFDSNAPTVVRAETDPDTLVGTLKYMSPEQVRHQVLDHRSDIFSLGVVIYEMITGEVAFPGETGADIVASILTTKPVSVSMRAPGIPPALERLVGRAMAKGKEARYQTIDELIRDLEIVERELETWRILLLRIVVRLGQMVRRNLAARLAAFVLLPALAGAGVWVAWNGFHIRKPPPKSGPPAVKLTDLKDAPQTVTLTFLREAPGESEPNPKFSPDGKLIAYSSIRGANTETIWIQSVASGTSVPLLSNVEPQVNPIWSPDGENIAFTSPQGPGTSIYMVAYRGGNATLLKEIVEHGTPVLKHWSKDGSNIYYEMKGNLFALSLASLVVAPVTSFAPSEVYDRDFSISPTEDRIAFRDKKDGEFSIWVRPTSGGTPERLTYDSADDSAPCWLPDGSGIIYSSDRGGVNQLCVAYLNGTKGEEITVGDSSYKPADVSAGGSRILYTSVMDLSKIWQVGTDQGKESEVDSALGVECWPVVSPDGKMIAFQDTLKPEVQQGVGHSTIVARPLPFPKYEWIPPISDGFDPMWLPDGSGLSFLRMRDSVANIWLVRPMDGEPTQITTAGATPPDFALMPYNRIENCGPSWSNDSSQVAYGSKRSGQYNIWIARADGSPERPLTDNTNDGVLFSSPIWSPDDKKIAFLVEARTSDLKTMWRVCVEADRDTRSLYASEQYLRLLGWSRSAEEIFCVSAVGESYRTATVRDTDLLQISAFGRGYKSVALLKSTYPFTVRLSPDKKKLLFVSRKDGKDDIWIRSIVTGKEKKVTANTDPNLYFTSPSWSPSGTTIYYGRQERRSVVSMMNFK